ncbi:MutS-related protein [Namhaeicola litoreus]|uniref:DNA mismatch repair protein MutS n=1 Tax=Namhaeicola litoreus TaxID=1052145 RepID=A0ABW3Y1F4_9FLAO
MQNPSDFYHKQLVFFQDKEQKLKTKIRLIGIGRLLVFLFGAGLTYLFFKQTILSFSLAILFIGLFIYLIFEYNKFQKQYKKTIELISLNQWEIEIGQGNFSRCDSGEEFISPDHPFSYDLDLFGKNSFFAYLNRTATQSGKNRLAQALSSNDISNIKEKQESIIELCQKPEWRQDFIATAKLAETGTDEKSVLNWIKNHRAFLNQKYRFLPIAFSAISLVIIALVHFSILPFSLLTLWFFLGLGITMIWVKKIQSFGGHAGKAYSTIAQYEQLIKSIEEESFETILLKTKQTELLKQDVKASKKLLEFSRLLDKFDQRNNLFIGILGNALFLRDILLVYKIELWLNDNKNEVEKWFETLSFFDAQISLGNFAFNHPQYTFPKLISNRFCIDSTQIGHPLINFQKRVENDFKISTEEFFIITGANMAGKSTFLRTIGLSILMANCGLPVCAKKFEYHPIALISSMRTNDSLSKEESYFFSELKRLKLIVDEIKNKTYFIILDEILKGTNSQDKALGSRKFLSRLANSGSTGLIATHDLSLCNLSESAENIQNYYFDAEIIDDELHFDYQMKSGICQNMNASFLLKKMEIV